MEEKFDFVATRNKSALPLYQEIISTSNSIYMPSFVLVSQNAQLRQNFRLNRQTMTSINRLTYSSKYTHCIRHSKSTKSDSWSNRQKYFANKISNNNISYIFNNGMRNANFPLDRFLVIDKKINCIWFIHTDKYI